MKFVFVTVELFPSRPVLWTSIMYYWLQGENACGRVGAKAALEEVELNQVESRVKKNKTYKKHVF